MKKILAVIATSVLGLALMLGGLVRNQVSPFEQQARQSTGAIFTDGRFECSGTEIGHTQEGNGIFLTARHCVVNTETEEIVPHLMVSFTDNQGGPYYIARPLALSLTDDLALLELHNGANIPEVPVKTEWRLKSGDPIFNVSFPLGTGKVVFHGEYMASRFPFFPTGILGAYKQWFYAMPMNMTIAHGSSGSGVYSTRERALIGVAVGTFEEGTYNIAIPADRVIDFLNDLQDNTVEKYRAASPVHAAPEFEF